jgi:hypothetical protein
MSIKTSPCKPIVLFHIPKCAGSSLHHYFMQKGLRQFFIYDKATNLSILPPRLSDLYFFDHKNYDLILPDHMNIQVTGFYEDGANNFDYITMARDPVQRFISGFYHIKHYHKIEFLNYEAFARLPYHEVMEASHLKDMIDQHTIKDCFEDPEKIEMIENCAIPHLGFNIISKMLSGAAGYGNAQYNKISQQLKDQKGSVSNQSF